MTTFEVVTAIQVAIAHGHMCPTAEDIRVARAACIRINAARKAANLEPFR